jgi:chemotaxis signal transduction protein
MAPAGDPSAAHTSRYRVCTTRGGRRIGVPLDGISRLEHYDREQLQSLGSRLVVRRGDRFTPVIDADTLLGEPPAAAHDTLRIVVLNDDRAGIGLAVGRILDVVTAESDLQPALAATGVAGSLALGGLATEVLDLASASQFSSAP